MFILTFLLLGYIWEYLGYSPTILPHINEIVQRLLPVTILLLVHRDAHCSQRTLLVEIEENQS